MQTQFSKWVILSLMAVIGLSAQAGVIEGRVVRVVDGDTIRLLSDQHREFRIRLVGIDAPEVKQAHGKAAMYALEDLIEDEDVEVEYNDKKSKDPYGRVLGTVFLNGQNINFEQIANGHAWYYRQYAKDLPAEWQSAYDTAEIDARDNRRGLWKSDWPQAPWDFRKANR